MSGRFPLFTDENVDGPIVRGLRQRGWDVRHATQELGEHTKDAALLQLAASLDRVFVSTDKDMLRLAKDWLRAGRAFRMIWWEQSTTQRIRLSVVLDAFDELASQERPFAYPIAYLKLPKWIGRPARLRRFRAGGARGRGLNLPHILTCTRWGRTNGRRAW